MQDSDVWSKHLARASPAIFSLPGAGQCWTRLQSIVQATKLPDLGDYVMCVDIEQHGRQIFTGTRNLGEMQVVAASCEGLRKLAKRAKLRRTAQSNE